jgi:Lipase (class 2)
LTRIRLALFFTLAAAVLVPASAQAGGYAPVDRPGPALTVPQSQLDASLECSPSLSGGTSEPVLLVPGTGATPEDNWEWTYVPAFNMLNIKWCTVELPEHSTADIQTAGEYVVNGIRTMSAAVGGKIDVVGHSQGGMLPRWAFRFWPDTRALVDDQVGFAASNHGTTQASFACQGSCSAADWQQSNSSKFIAALNSFQESFSGIDYTEIYTHTDEIVQPNSDDTGSSSLHDGGANVRNVATQDICPLDTYEHLALGTIDPAAYALAIDALTNDPGPADPSRVNTLTSCPPAVPLQPGVDPLTFPSRAITAAINVESAPSTQLTGEPPLRCYVFADGCPPSAANAANAQAVYGGPKTKCSKKKRRHAKKHRKRCHKKKHRKRGK